MELKFDVPQAVDLETSAQRMLTMAKAYMIDSPTMYDAAAEDLKSVKARAKQLEEQRKAITGPLDSAKKAIMDLFRRPTEFLEQAESTLKSAMLAYQREEQRKVDERNRSVEEAARKERERIEAEARAKLEEAQALAAEGNDRAAEEAHAAAATMQTAAIVATAPVVQTHTSKVAGISVRETWKARIIDKATALKHIAEHPELHGWIDFNMSPINQMAKALKKNMAIPGIEAYPEEGLAARA